MKNQVKSNKINLLNSKLVHFFIGFGLFRLLVLTPHRVFVQEHVPATGLDALAMTAWGPRFWFGG